MSSDPFKKVERDYQNERSVHKHFASYPLKFWWGLNKFETIQGIHSLLGNAADLVVSTLSFIPGVQGRNNASYIENSIRVTRFRNFDDKTQ
ncbi:hypothetical protein ABPG74_016055 [Tetrahymena malaccensis]